MKIPLNLLRFAFAGVLIASVTTAFPQLSVLSSPDNRLVCTVGLEDGQAYYRISVDGQEVLERSRLGVVLDTEDFSRDLSWIGPSELSTVEDDYELLHGKKRVNSYRANRTAFRFRSSGGHALEVIFQVSDDGVAFRYVFPEESASVHRIVEEVTSFNFSPEARAWMQPMDVAKTGYERTNPSYERHYEVDVPVGTPSPSEAGWVYPALFRAGQSWVVVSEADLGVDYCGTRLRKDSPGGEYVVGFPQAEEVMHGGALNPESTWPWQSPWRVVAIGDLATLVESNLGSSLAAPALAGDFSWVKPGRASWSWVLLKDGATVPSTQIEFIDYAADMGWEYCLVDALWDTQIGYEEMENLARYAGSKGVELLVWYNSAGDWNGTPQTPRDKMVDSQTRLAEFRRIKAMGIAGVKVDFFGGDGQSVIQYYHDILKSAAEVGILVNFHGCTLPRGWHRTYPNLLTAEAIMGQEFITFSQDNADAQASHCAMLPFTRNLFDPMDFTPVALWEIPGIQRRTTSSFELALSVLFLSGIQHYAETPEGMSKMPEYVKEFLREVTPVWDETRLLDGEPGKHVVIARRSGAVWYVGGINGEGIEKTLQLALPGSGAGFFITDAGDQNAQFKKMDLDGSDLTITLRANGGFVAKVQVER